MLNVYFTGTAGNSLLVHNGMEFTTHDVDNDLSNSNCALDRHGPWWFKRCGFAHLNGEYLGGRHNQSKEGIRWSKFKGSYYSYKVAEMKVGPHKN